MKAIFTASIVLGLAAIWLIVRKADCEISTPVGTNSVSGDQNRVSVFNPAYGPFIIGCGILVTNDNEFAFGGWPLEMPALKFENGTFVWSETAEAYLKDDIKRAPVYRVRMTPEESKMLYHLMQRAVVDSITNEHDRAAYKRINGLNK